MARCRSFTVITSLVAGTVLVACSVAALGQPAPDPKPAIDAVGQLSFLVGEWAGEGWIQMGPNGREEFTQTEKVEAKLDGAAILIEGIGHSKEATPQKVHHALAVVSYDPVKKKPVFSSFVAGRPPLVADVEAAPGRFVWSFSPPNGGHVRYTITVDGAKWREIGEHSRDGQQWSQFFEMSLDRK